MRTQPKIIGTDVPTRPRKSYRLRQAIAEAARSESAVDLLRELALGLQPERPLTVPTMPRWAALAMRAEALAPFDEGKAVLV